MSRPIRDAASRLTGGRTTQVAGVVRSAGGRVSRLSYGTRVRFRASLPRRGPVPGLLSIVVPCYDVEAYLDECLVSLRFQNYRDVEILVVDDGSPDRSAEIARRHVRRDPRVRLVRRENGGLSAARNTGVEHAHGEFLTFVDSDDVVQPDAYTSALDALRESGSDFAVCNYDRFDRGTRKQADRHIRLAHERRRLGVTIDEFPDVMVNAVAWSKVYRRRFWDEAALSFPVGKLYEDQPVSMAAFARATAFDVLPDIGVSWRIRHERTSISQASYTARNLAAHNETVAASLEALEAAGHRHAAELRALQLLANNLPNFTRHILRADEEFWALLGEAIRELVGHISPDLYVREVAAHNKILNELVMQGRRDDAHAFLAGHGADARRFATRLDDDGAWLRDPPFGDALPDYVNRLSDAQLYLVCRALRVSFTGDGSLEIGGWAYVRNLDLGANDSQLSVTLVDRHGRRVPMDVSRYDEPRAGAGGDHWFSDYRPSGFSARLPVDRIPRGEGRWEVAIRLTVGPVEREASLAQVSAAGAAQVAHSWVREDGEVITVAMVQRRLTVAVQRSVAFARSAAIDSSGMLTVGFRADAANLVVLSRADHPRPLASATPVRTGDGWTARLRLPLDERFPETPWRVRVVHDQRETDLLAPAGTPDSPGVRTVAGSPAVTRGRLGELEIHDRLPVCSEVAVTAAHVTIAVSDLQGRDHWQPVLRLGNGDAVHELPGVVGADDDGRPLLVFPMLVRHWAHDGLAPHAGKYTVALRSPDGVLVPVVPSHALARTLPVDHLTSTARVAVEAFAGPPLSLAILVGAPLTDDERGARNQHRLRTECRVEEADRASVFFRSLYGEVTNCNGLAVHEELLRRGSPLELLWSVKDRSVAVPEGGVGLVEGSRAWHEAIARSRYHMVNVHQLEWFEKPAGQVMIQTMHGYPYKVMGHDWWRKGGFPGPQVASFDRRARAWDYFVSPASYATPLLDDAFLAPASSEAEVLEIGYPRNDVLVSPRGEKIRRQARELLGARDDQVVVMYAPTFRDYLSPDDMTAQRVDFFDARAAARQLGDGYVLLVRGHAFNARAGSRGASSTNVIDVTDYPDVNDLILASDVAVLDYSSLRFDYALTGKPMVFLVPDLERYDRSRGGVIAYEPTAPGPQVRTTREVVRLLADLPALRSSTAPLLKTFRRDYVDLDDGHAAERLVDTVFVPRGDARPSR